MHPSKRLFLKSTAATLTTSLLASCGGGSSSDAVEPDLPEVEPELVQELESLEPLPSAFDLSIDPMRLVSGPLSLQVIQDGVPVSGALVRGYNADGSFIFESMTDESGRCKWVGERTWAVRLVAQVPQGELSIYDVEDPQNNFGPLVLNVLTSLADRIRIARHWLPSQANLRVHQFCDIPSSTPLWQTFMNHAEFDHGRFASAVAASGLSQDAYLEHLCQLAIRDDFAMHSVSFASTSKQLKFDPMSILTPIFDNAMKALDDHLSDDEKMKLFGGLLVEFGFLNLTDPVLKAIDQINQRLNDVQVMINQVLEELRVMHEQRLGADIEALSVALASITDVVSGKAQLTAEEKHNQIIEIIEKKELKGGALPIAAVRAFLGGLAMLPYDPNKAVYPSLMKRKNSVDVMTGQFDNTVPSERMRFYGYEREQMYLQALNNVRVMFAMGMAWAMTHQAKEMSSAKDRNGLDNARSQLRQLATDLITFKNLLDAFETVPLPHKDVFLEIEDHVAWFAPKEFILDDPSFYGAWHGWSATWINGGPSNKPWSGKWGSNLRLCHEKLPAAIRAMANEPWSPPTKAQVEKTFFKPAAQASTNEGDKNKKVAAYAVAHGAPSDGVFMVNELGKPKLNIWLADLKYVETRPWTVYDRGYARFHERDFRNQSNSCSVSSPTFESAPAICESYAGNSPASSGIHSLGNYGNSTNYYYPSNSHVVNPEQYYPWHRMRQVLEKTNGLKFEKVREIYGPK